MRMRSTLRQIITAETTLAELHARAQSAPAAAPISLDIALPEGDDWISLLPTEQPFWYRATPSLGEYRLGIGHALQITSTGPNRFAALENAWRGLRQHWCASPQACAFSGFAFADDNDAPLPNALLALPSLLLTRTPRAAVLTLTAITGRLEESIQNWAALLAATQRWSSPDLPLQTPSPLAQAAWRSRVNAALDEIAAGYINKVVLTRQHRLKARQTIASGWLLRRLNEQQAESLVFAHGQGRHCFLGATPERLLRLRGGQIEVDALAGTAWPGSPALDIAKNRQEQALVVDAVRRALASCCIAPPEISVQEESSAGQLRHLRNRLTGQVRNGLGLYDLIRQIHPTPAVGGHPTLPALHWLAQHGEKRTAWYSGGFGVLQADGDAEFSVALRSALVDGAQLELQAGAGIVEGSDADQEWAETEAKFGTLLQALCSTQSQNRVA